MSGKSNVIFWLEKRGITPTDAVVDRVFQKAKASPTVLTEEEILAAVYQYRMPSHGSRVPVFPKIRVPVLRDDSRIAASVLQQRCSISGSAASTTSPDDLAGSAR